MSDFHFDMTSEGDETFKKALSLFEPPGRKVEGYKFDEKKNRVILYWSPGYSGNCQAFFYTLTLDQAADFVLGWLNTAANYGEQPDTDGCCSPGWRLYNESYGRIGDDHYAFAAIEPIWIIHGK